VKPNLLLKLFLLAGLFGLFGVGLLTIDGVVGDRERYRDEVIADVARSTAGQQTLFGPMLIVPYLEPATVQTGGPRTSAPARVRNEAIVLPESLFISTSVKVEARHRGIHKAQVFRAANRLTVIFQVPANLGISDAGVSGAGAAHLTFGVSDSRGMHRPPVVEWDGERLEVEPGSGQPWIAQGFSAEVGNLFSPHPRRIRVNIDLELVGTNQLSFVPAGASTRVEMQSNWPDPSFVGQFLPDTRTIDASGFRAGWELSRFATDVAGEAERLRVQGGSEDQRKEATLTNFGVRFMEQVDVYQKADRAVKYGMLFVLLTFVAFFVFEVLKRMDLHPMQYLLAGSGVAVFFLLLLSLSEHVPFIVAYLVAAGACIALLIFYVSSVFGSVARGVSFGAMLALLYALLFVILESKDYALLLGTLLLFGVLAAVMVLTRRIDWYKVGEKPPGA
jgi:inner membrane protein